MFTRTTTVLFWVMMVCCVWAFHGGLLRRMGGLRAVRWAEEKTEAVLPWVTWACLGLALAGGLLMRLYLFPGYPGGINQDGAMATLDGIALAKYGTDRLGTPWPAHLEAWGKGQMSALLSYILAGMYKLFGVSRWTLRLPQLLLSLLSLAVGWDFARRTLGKTYGYIALILLLLNPWQIMQSRWTIDCAMFPHFFLYGAYCLLRGYTGKRGWYYGGMVCFALSMYTYGISLYTVPFFLLPAVLVLLTEKRIRWYDALGCAAVYLLISAPFLATMFLNWLGGKDFKLFGFTIQFFEESIRSEEILLMQPELYPGFVRNAKSLLDILLFQTDGYMYMDLPTYGSSYLFTLPLIIVGIVLWLGDRITKRVPWLEKADRETVQATAGWGMLMVSLWLIVAVWAGLITDQIHLGRGAIIMYPIIFMIAYAIYRIGARQKLLAVVLVLVHLFGGLHFGLEYFSPQQQQALGYYYYADLTAAMEATRGRSFDTLYITESKPEPNQYGIPEELLVEYAHRLDARYAHAERFDEEMIVTDPDGREWLPFDERYQMMDLTTFLVDPEEDCLYIVYDYDTNEFDPELFDLEQFGEYYVVTPKR